MRIPASKIVTGSYTSNGDYVYKSSKNIYKGYYYSISGKSYIGKNYDPTVNAKEIIPIKKVTYTSKDFLYDVLAGVKDGSATPIISSPVKNKTSVLSSIQEANQQGLTPVIGINPDADINSLNTASGEQVASSTITTKKRYFFRVLIATKPADLYKFGEVKDEEQFNALTKKPNHTTAAITQTQIPGEDPVFNDPELNAAEKKMPGLKQFLGVAE